MEGDRMMSPPLRGLFYAHFDDKDGPQFVHLVPEDLLEESLMERVLSYVLPQLELSGSLVTVRHSSQFKLMSCPMYLEGSIYPRHRFTFAFGMVFGQDDDVGPYGPVLRKISRFFHKLEKDVQFLSNRENGAHVMLGSLLSRIMDGLVQRGECIVRVLDAKTILALKLFPKLLDPPPVSDFQVPVFTRNIRSVMLKDWDLTIQRLEQFIDGRRFVKRIAIESQMDIDLVRRALRQLLYYRVIVMLDVFQYSNRYACTKKVAELATNENLQLECRQQCTKDPSRGLVPFPKLFNIFSSLHPSAPYGDFCIEFATDKNGIDDQRLITFGLTTGVLRRVRSVPVALVNPLPLHENVTPKGLKSNDDSDRKMPPLDGDTQRSQLRALVDSGRGFDELCGMTTFSPSEVALMFDNMEDVVVVRL